MNADQWFGLGCIVVALVVLAIFGRESRRRREVSPVVPLGDLLHEQDSAEAYDDTPDMDVQRFVEGYNAAREEMRQEALNEAQRRKAWEDEWERRLALDFDGGPR